VVLLAARVSDDKGCHYSEINKNHEEEDNQFYIEQGGLFTDDAASIRALRVVLVVDVSRAFEADYPLCAFRTIAVNTPNTTLLVDTLNKVIRPVASSPVSSIHVNYSCSFALCICWTFVANNVRSIE